MAKERSFVKTILAGNLSAEHIHNLGHTDYVVLVTQGPTAEVEARCGTKNANNFYINIDAPQLIDMAFEVTYREK
uniref:Uncharacterized protein n=1 Tax=viral metagenome TaxID=1070528 RepID=A0A6H2A0M8_9ZZZZ